MAQSSTRIFGSLGSLAVFYGALVVAPQYVRPAAPPADTGNSALVREAKQLVGVERWADALRPVQQLVAAYPRNHVYAEQLAIIQHHLGKPVEEAAAWEAFVSTSPNPFEACPHIGNAYRDANDIPKAIDAFERCLAYQPDDPDLMFDAAHAFEWKDDWKAAKSMYQKAAAADPDNLDTQVGLGRVALHDGDFKTARAIGERVFAANNNSDAALLAGMAAARAGQTAAARALFERALAVSPDRADIRDQLDKLGPTK